MGSGKPITIVTTIVIKTPSTDQAQEANIEAILQNQLLVTIGTDQGRDQGNLGQLIKGLQLIVGKIRTEKSRMISTILKSKKEEDQI